MVGPDDAGYYRQLVGRRAGEEAGEDAGEEAGEEADEEADEEAGRRSGRRSSSDEEALASSQGQAWDGRMEVDESGEEAGGDDTQDDPVL